MIRQNWSQSCYCKKETSMLYTLIRWWSKLKTQLGNNFLIFFLLLLTHRMDYVCADMKRPNKIFAACNKTSEKWFEKYLALFQWSALPQLSTSEHNRLNVIPLIIWNVNRKLNKYTVARIDFGVTTTVTCAQSIFRSEPKFKWSEPKTLEIRRKKKK